MVRRSWLGLVANAVAFVAFVGVSHVMASSGDIIGLGTPEGDVGGSCPTAINDHNVVVGVSTAAQGAYTGDAFIYTSDSGIKSLPGQDHSKYSYTPSDINNQGVIAITKSSMLGFACITTGDGQIPILYQYAFGSARAINESGVVVGNTFGAADPNGFGARYSRQYLDGQWQWTIERFDYGGVANDINDSGVIVGTWGNRAKRYTDATGLQDLGGGLYSTALGINDVGVVVGSCFSEGVQRAFKYTDSQGVQLLPDPVNKPLLNQYTACVARAINEAGVMVGQGNLPGAAWRALLWEPQGEAIDLETWFDLVNPEEGAHWFLADAVDINDKGMLVGWGFFGDGSYGGNNEYRGFMLDVSGIAVPEPATLTLLALGITSLLICRRSYR